MRIILKRALPLLDANRRVIGAAIAAVLAANMVVAVRHVEPTTVVAGVHAPQDGIADPIAGGPVAVPSSAGSKGARATSAAKAALAKNPHGLVGPYIPGKGTIPLGITDRTIKVVYYWKGDATMSSQFLRGKGTGQEGNVDEGEAFSTLIAYLNKYKNGGGTFMGFPFDLHGRTIVGEVKEAGKSPDTYAALANEITQSIKPFATISSHGSLSAYMCPAIAKAGIHNFSTYDLGGKGGTLLERTNGYCYGSGTSWEHQVDTMLSYLRAHRNTRYETVPGATEKRVYGILYAEYPGLVDVIDSVVARFRRAGINIPPNAVAAMPPDLTTAQTVAKDKVDQLRGAGVNTIISPDAGAPLNFTHAAQASGYNPDYVVWPCSGQDSTGMVRLYDPVQWSRAKGLTCYDPWFNADLTNDDLARSTDWYAKYREIKPGYEPPAPTPLVYQGLLPLVVGLTNAERDITVERFRAGIASFKAYRYMAVRERKATGKNLLLTIGDLGGSLVGDVAVIKWDNTQRTSGSATQGTYVYLEDRRYARGAVFS